jgi:hypothetical protein
MLIFVVLCNTRDTLPVRLLSRPVCVLKMSTTSVDINMLCMRDDMTEVARSLAAGLCSLAAVVALALFQARMTQPESALTNDGVRINFPLTGSALLPPGTEPAVMQHPFPVIIMYFGGLQYNLEYSSFKVDYCLVLYSLCVLRTQMFVA